MNNIHKFIYNRNIQQYVATSVRTKSSGKPKAISAKSVNIVSILQNFSEKQPLVKYKATEETLQSLNRDTQNANQKLDKQDLSKAQERQEMAQTIGQISEDWLQFAVEDKLKEADKKRQEAEAIEKENPTKSAELKAQAQAIESEYGLGSNLQMGVRAATAALQGLATGNTNQATVGLLSPYANKLIKEQTGDNKEANLIAHAVLGAVEAHLTGNNAATGAVGALTAEAVVPHLMKSMYGTDKPTDLTESQKQNIANLSQITAGLVGGLTGDSTIDFISGAEIGKRAVENNYFGEAFQNPQYTLALALKSEGEKVKENIELEANKQVAEEVIDTADKYFPQYVSINGQIYGIGGKTAINLRNGDIVAGGIFSPVALPNRFGSSATASLGWITNLDDIDLKTPDGKRLTSSTINKVIEGNAFSASGCYKFGCLGYGQTIPNNRSDKKYNTFEIGVGIGGSGGNINQEKTQKVGDLTGGE